MPLVSIVIPIYNVDLYLDELLTTLSQQTLKDIEIICVNDGSTDKSEAIIKKHQEKDSRIKYIYQQNQGGGAARNTGITQAKGEYLICLDSDDIYDSKMIEILYNQAKKTNADITICDFNQINMTTGHKVHNKGINKKLLPDKEVFSRQDVSDIFEITNPGPCNKLYKTNFIKKNNLKYSTIRAINDLSFSKIALMLAEKITVVDNELTTYRYLSDVSISPKRGKHSYQSFIAFKEIFDAMKKQGLYEELKQSYINIVTDSINYECGFIVAEQYIEELKKFLQQEPFTKFDKKEIQKIFRLKRRKKNYFEYTILNMLNIGLSKSIKTKLNRSKNILKNYKAAGIL